MLEEALRNATLSPAETALALSSFIQMELPAGGASAEKRFFNIFVPLCERVFGRLSKPEQKYLHELGGWLSRDIKWERPQSSISQQPSSLSNRVGVAQSSKSSSNLLSSDPVVQLLGTGSHASLNDQHPPTLIEAFTKEAEHHPNLRYPFPFHALPKPTQDAWIALLENALTAGAYAPNPATPTKPLSENSSRLLGALLREKPIHQEQLKSYHQQKARKKEHVRPLQLSPVYPTPISPSQAANPKGEKSSPPMVMLSMLEYFLFMFIRYPLAAPSVPAKPQVGQTIRGVPIPQRRAEHYGEAVYYFLFYEYLRHFIPCNNSQSHFNGFHVLSRPSELFLRTVIELWIEGQYELKTIPEILREWQDRGQASKNYDLNHSFDLVKGGNFDPPPQQVQKCIRRLIISSVSDATLLGACREIRDGLDFSKDAWCLSPTMTILQLPFYNFVRNAFRNGSMHTSQSPFFVAFNAWLIWLEPWNATHSTRRTGAPNRLLGSVASNLDRKKRSAELKIPAATSSSRYSSIWEPYIAANFFLYLVPLAIFLRRARELDFTPKEFNSSLRVVQRVFRVYSPPVVKVLNRLLASRRSGSSLGSILLKHEKHLGKYAPLAEWTLSLSSCQDDMRNLLEEIHIQHQKKAGEQDFFDRILARLEGLFGQGVLSGEEKALGILVRQAKTIVDLPHGYEVVPSDTETSTFLDGQAARSIGTVAVARTNNGLLSDYGRQRVLDGTEKCNPLDTANTFDRMKARPQSYEFALLVPLLIRFSEYLNIQLGLLIEKKAEDREDGSSRLLREVLEAEASRKLRINLRFLADYRNLLFIAILYWIWKTLGY